MKFNNLTSLLSLPLLAVLTSHSGAAIVSTGLVGYYDFNGNGNDTAQSLGGNSTATNGVLVDAISDGTSGTLEAAFDSGTTAFGSGSLAVTNGDYFSLGYPDELKFGSGSFTFTYWMRIPNNISGDPSILSNKNWSASGGSSGFSHAIQGDDVDSNIASGGSRVDPARIDLDAANAGQGPANTPAGWVFLAMTVDRSTNQFTNYVADTFVSATSPTYQMGVSGADFGQDGSEPTVGDITGLGSFDTDDLGNTINIGQDGDGAGYSSLSANIDDLSVWDRALSREELWEVYYTGRQGNPLTDIVTAVPEPSSSLLLALAGLAGLVRRRR